MNPNGKQMKPEAARSTNAQWCEIITKLSKPNVSSRWALGQEYEVNEGAIRKVWDNWENILQQREPIEAFAKLKSATYFKDFEALHNIVLDIDNQLHCSDVQTEAGQMYDELQWSFETFQRNADKLTLNVKR